MPHRPTSDDHRREQPRCDAHRKCCAPVAGEVMHRAKNDRGWGVGDPTGGAPPDKFPTLFDRNALPGDLAVFLAFTDPARRGNAVIGVVAAIGAVFPADSSRQLFPSVTYHPSSAHPP